jgi:hypothetical protein
VPRTFGDERERTVYSMETVEQDMNSCICREMHGTLLHPNFPEEDNKLSTAEGSTERRQDAEFVLLGK